MTEEERCKQTALDRLKDAFALYNAERYPAALYMCGYVIEIGIKAEFYRLANITLSSVDNKAGFIINQLFKSHTQSELMNYFRFPTTIFEFTKLLSDISIAINSTSGIRVFNKLNDFQIILTNQPATKSHDIPAFLMSLNEWRIAVGEPDFVINNYDIQKLEWGTYLRYGEASPNNKEVEQSDSRDALEMAINFLKDVVLVDVSEFESQLSSNNISTPNNAGV